MSQTDSTPQHVTSAPSAQPGTATRPAWSDRLPRPWMFPLLAFAASWAVTVATWFVSDALHGHSQSWTYHFLFKDAGWFMTIARDGYPAHFLIHHRPAAAPAFFPVFPLLIRLAGRALGSYLAGGLVVTVVAGAASSILVWLVADRVRDRRVADRAVLLYCLFPGAMAFGMMYSEGVTVTLAAAALLALMTRRWVLAGVIAAIGTAEASILFVLIPVAGIVALQAIWQRREWTALAAPVLAPLGALAFFGYLGRRYHDYGFWFKTEQSGWGEHIDWGAHNLHLVLWQTANWWPGYTRTAVNVIDAIMIVMMAVTVAGIVAVFFARLPLPLSLYTVLLAATFLLSPAGPRPRYVLCAFPLFIGAAAKLPRAVYWPILVVSAAGLAFVTDWWQYHYAGPNL